MRKFEVTPSTSKKVLALKNTVIIVVHNIRLRFKTVYKAKQLKEKNSEKDRPLHAVSQFRCESFSLIISNPSSIVES